jgi:phosphoesterase RecJ-like protein
VDAIFVLDNSAPERLGRLRETIESSPAPKVCIDHHPDPDPLWQVRLIRETACATGEVVYDLIRGMGGEVTPEMATALYTAVVTDTGHFRFSNTTAATHRLAGKLMEHGVAADRIYQELFEQTSPSFARLLGASLASLEIVAGGAMGVFRITRELVRRCRAEGEDTSEIINEVLGIAGIRLAVLLKELPDGRTKVSFRSKGAIDVNHLARRFGGGGHRNASGAVLDEAMAAAEPRVLEQAMALVTGASTGETGATRARP